MMRRTDRNSIIRKVAKRVVNVLLVTVLALSIVNLIYMSTQMKEEIKTELDLVTILSTARISDWSNRLEGVTADIADTLSGLETVDEITVKKVLNKHFGERSDCFSSFKFWLF